MTTPLNVTVTLPIEEGHILPGKEKEFFFGDFAVDRALWQVHAVQSSGPCSVAPGSREPIVSVTVHTVHHRGSRAWFRPSNSLAVGLPTEPPPEWVPPAPAWFEALVTEMQEAAS